MAVLDIRKGTPSGVRTPRPINTRRCHSEKRRVVSPRVIHRETIGIGVKADLQKLAASVNEEARQLALAARATRGAGTCHQGVDTQFATKSVRSAAPFARAERPLRHARLLGVEGPLCSLIAGFRVARQACVCASHCLSPCSSRTALSVSSGYQVGVFTALGVVALSELPEMLLPDFRVMIPMPYRRLVL